MDEHQIEQVILSTIKIIGQSIGINHINDSIASLLGHETQMRILSILSDAVQLKKTRLGTQLKINDINNALKANQMTPCFGYPHIVDLPYEKVQKLDAIDILALPDNNNLLEDPPQFIPPQYPLEAYFEMEWLAINGQTMKTVEKEIELQEENEASIQKQNAVSNIPQQSDELSIASSKHVFSYEYQLFYRTSLDHLLSNDKYTREHMLHILSTERSIQPLIPYYIRFSLHTLKSQPYDFNNIYIACNVIRQIVMNDYLNHQIYYEKYISLALTFLLSPLATVPNINEFCQIKDDAADILKRVCDNSAEFYPLILPNITKQLLTVLLYDKELSAKYGALRGLIGLGLITNSNYIAKILPELEASLKQISPEKNHLASRFHDLIIFSYGLLVHRDSYYNTANGNNTSISFSEASYQKNIAIFGEDLHRFYIDDFSLMSY